MVQKLKPITMSEFVELVLDQPKVVDVPLKNIEWSLGEDFALLCNGMRTDGALPSYQAKSLTGHDGIDLTDQSKLRVHALAGDGQCQLELHRQVAQLNIASRDYDKELVGRTYISDDGVIVLGGIVSKGYEPVTHEQLLDLMTQNVGFNDALVYKNKVTPKRMDAVIMLDGHEWEVDGGVKRGMRIKNGQFGDYAYGWMGMLFHLLCTNGMMDVVSSEQIFKRHTNLHNIDMAADLVAAMKRGDRLFELSRKAVEVPVDTVDTLIQLHRRRFLSRGALSRAAEHVEDMGGVGSQQRAESLWGVAQVITAAARGYSMSQYDQMGRLAGRLVTEGVDAVMATRVLPKDAPTTEEIREVFFEAAA